MDALTPPSEISFTDFLKVDIRVGTIVGARLNEKARKPAYVLTIDFGATLGSKESSAQITEHYSAEELVNSQILAVVNFPDKNIAGVISQCLVLATVCPKNGTKLIRPSAKTENGTRVL